jgi:hypothetical protein
MNRFLRHVCPLIVVLAISGCSEQDEIRRYKVKTSNPETQVAAVRSGEPARMLAAILFDGEMSWFLKLTGSPQDAGTAADGVRSLLKSVRFVDDEPQWTLPEGWSETKSNGGIRFATLTVPAGDGSMELSVIPLPFTTDRDDWLLSNINRWRVEQLSLPGLEIAELATAFESVDYDGGGVAHFVDITGTKKASRMGGAPFAPFAGRASSGPAGAAVPADPPSSEPPTVTTPEGWTRSSNDQFSMLAYDTPGGPRFTATRLGGPIAKDLLKNINRWRGQVGLKNLTADELTSNVEEIDVDGNSASYTKAVGEEKTILGVVLVRDGLAWFFKLTGKSAAAEVEREHFEQLLQSIKFPSE